MKILWVADFGLQHNIGGAQRTDSFVIEEGKKRGHDIYFFNYDTPTENLLEDYDMVVSGNLESLCRRAEVFNFITNHKRHVRFEHDANSYLKPEQRKILFNSTKKNIFLSEFHHKSFVHLYGDIFPNVEIVSPYIDTSVFKNNEEEREDKTLYVGFFHFLKGTAKFMEYVLSHPQKQFVVAGWGHKLYEGHMKSFHNVEFLGKINHSDMSSVFNKYKTLYYHPEKFEPFCRSVGEAILCGMEVNTSDNIGAVYDYRTLGLEKMRHNCSTSNTRWWELVE
jgi:glycosyltransferase involved in cell wall biosynthesis